MDDVEHVVLSEWFNFIRKEIPLRVDLIGNLFSRELADYFSTA